MNAKAERVLLKIGFRLFNEVRSSPKGYHELGLKVFLKWMAYIGKIIRKKRFEINTFRMYHTIPSTITQSLEKHKKSKLYLFKSDDSCVLYTFNKTILHKILLISLYRK